MRKLKSSSRTVQHQSKAILILVRHARASYTNLVCRSPTPCYIGFWILPRLSAWIPRCRRQVHYPATTSRPRLIAYNNSSVFTADVLPASILPDLTYDLSFDGISNVWMQDDSPDVFVRTYKCPSYLFSFLSSSRLF